MIFFSFKLPSKSGRIILPGILIKDIKPISLLLKPSNLIIPLLLVSILSQLSDNLKNTLSPKDIQNLYSVKFYRKIVFFGFNSISLSVVQAISKTLGSELESLSVLSVSERLLFLRDLQRQLILDKVSSNVYMRNFNSMNPLEIMKYRKNLSIQFRSSIVSNSIFSPNSLTFGIPINSLGLDLVVYSSKLIWISLGLLEEDFDFFLRKEAINCLKTFNLEDSFVFPSNNIEALKILFFKEIKDLLVFNKLLDFSPDNIIIKGESNLVLLEKEIGFIKRDLPIPPKDIFVSDNDLDDVLLRSALDQRRKYKFKLDNIYTIDNKLINTKKQSVLRNIKLKRFLNQN